MERRQTILIAEPKEALWAQLRPFLNEMRFDALQANSLQETLLTLQSSCPDVLVLDADILGEDCGFLSIIKGMGEDLPIIICAETNTPEFESKVRQQRIFFYHIKSFGTEDLEMAIANAVHRPSH